MWMFLAILFPDQLQRQAAMTLQVVTNRVEIGPFVLAPDLDRARRAGHGFLELPVVPVGRQRPFHAGRGGCFQVVMYGTLSDQATAGDLLLLEPEGMQP